MTKTTDQKLDALANTVGSLATALENGFAAIAGDISDLRQDVRDLRADMNEGFRSLRSEVAELHARIEALEAAVHNHTGYRKEIDYLFERLAAVEQHLGINRKIAA